jgi:hypothetical protein
MLSIRSNVACAMGLGAALLLQPAPAEAHFVLVSPTSWSVPVKGQPDMPEKLGPCGNEGFATLALNDAGQPIITAFQEGGMITVTINEVVPHPGHYRIALALDWADAGDKVQAGFPPDPMVTPGPTNSGSMVCAGLPMATCGSVPIVTQTPALVPGIGWILADNVFEHCAAFTKPQTIQVALPPGVTCNECVIQVLEFMSDHGLNAQGGCFYHHCANISIQGQGGSSGSASGASSGASTGATSGTVGSSGSASGASSGASSGTSAGASSGASTGAGTSGTTPTSGSAAMTGASPTAGSMASTGSLPTSGSTAAGVSTSGASSGTGAAGGVTGAPPSASSSSGCSMSPRESSLTLSLAGLGLAGTLIRRRRRR